jgi:hypothetical protein
VPQSPLRATGVGRLAPKQAPDPVLEAAKGNRAHEGGFRWQSACRRGSILIQRTGGKRPGPHEIDRTLVTVVNPGYLVGSFVVLATGYHGASVIDFLAHNKWQADERNRPNRIPSTWNKTCQELLYG